MPVTLEAKRKPIIGFETVNVWNTNLVRFRSRFVLFFKYTITNYLTVPRRLSHDNESRKHVRVKRILRIEILFMINETTGRWENHYGGWGEKKSLNGERRNFLLTYEHCCKFNGYKIKQHQWRKKGEGVLRG